MDVVGALSALVHSPWMVPALPVLIAADGPFPVLPSETLLMTTVVVAFTEHATGTLVLLFLLAWLGSAAGDLLVYGLGRGSHRLVGGRAERGPAAWVRGHVLARPGAVLVGARFMPGGRMMSTAAAGRFGLPLRTFVPWSLVSSAAWATYMVGVARAIEPVTGGDPLRCVLAGLALAGVMGGLFALAGRLRRAVRPAE